MWLFVSGVTVTIGTTSETTIKVDWQIGNIPDAVTEITVHWGTDLRETLEKGIETCTIKRLNPKTSYTIRVVVSLLNGLSCCDYHYRSTSPDLFLWYIID